MSAEMRHYHVRIEVADHYGAQLVVAAASEELAAAIGAAVANTHPHLWTAEGERRTVLVDVQQTGEALTVLGAPPEPPLAHSLTMRISEPQRVALAELVERTGQPRGALVRAAIDAWLHGWRRVAPKVA